MPLVEKPFRSQYATLFGIFILFGMSMTIIGATLPKILADFGWSYTTAGTVIAAGAIGYFAATYAAGFLVSLIGPKLTIGLGLVLEIAGLFLFAAIPSPFVNLILYLGIGLGQGCIELVVNWATFRMDKSGSGRALNLIHGAFAVGAFLGPFVIGMLIKFGLSWTLIYRGIAVMFVVVLVVLAFMPFSGLDRRNEEKKDSPRGGLTRKPAYWLGFTTLLVYVGVELGVSNWVAEYFVTVFKTSPATGSFMVSLFWVGLLAGRFGVPLLYRGKREDVLLIMLALTMAVSVIVLALVGYIIDGASVFMLASVLVTLAGLGCSCIYPVVVSLVGGAFPDAQSEAIGFTAMGGGIGAFVFPYAMSAIAAAWGIRAGFVAYAFFSVAVVVCCVALVRATKKVEAPY